MSRVFQNIFKDALFCCCCMAVIADFRAILTKLKLSYFKSIANSTHIFQSLAHAVNITMIKTTWILLVWSDNIWCNTGSNTFCWGEKSWWGQWYWCLILDIIWWRWRAPSWKGERTYYDLIILIHWPKAPKAAKIYFSWGDNATAYEMDTQVISCHNEWAWEVFPVYWLTPVDCSKLPFNVLYCARKYP